MSTRNVVLVCLDTVRKDFFDRYARRVRDLADVSFEQCRAASSWTIPSHASMLSGELPSEHGAHAHNRSFDHLDFADTFLADLPHSTYCISANPYLTELGFDEHFDDSHGAFGIRYPEAASLHSHIWETDESWPYLRFWRAADDLTDLYKRLANAAHQMVDDYVPNTPLPSVLDDGASNMIPHHCLKQFEEQDEPMFVYVNYMEAHLPLSHTVGMDGALHSASNRWTSQRLDSWELMSSLDEQEEYLCKRRELYGAAVEYLDRQVWRLITRIQSISERETTVIVTADHGENLGFAYENFHERHKSSLTESLLHVPCYLVNPPEGYDERESGYFSQLDMGELVAGLAANETPDVFSDSIRSELIGLCEPEPPGNVEYWDRMIRCRYEGDRKYVWDSTGNRTVYELPEGEPCRQRESSVGFSLDSFEAEFDVSIEDYKAMARDGRTETAIAESTKDRLEQLGYH